MTDSKFQLEAKDWSLRQHGPCAMGSLVWCRLLETSHVKTTNGCFQKSWYPQIIHFNRVFHYLHHFGGLYPYFWKHPNLRITCYVFFFRSGMGHGKLSAIFYKFSQYNLSNPREYTLVGWWFGKGICLSLEEYDLRLLALTISQLLVQ